MFQTIRPNYQFDADDYSEADAFELWHDIVGATHDVDVVPADHERFRLHMRVWNLGQMMISNGEFTPQAFSRDGGRIRHDQLDHYGLFIQGDGYRTTDTGDFQRRLETGDIQIFDLAQYCSSVASAGTSGTLYLPRDLVDEIMPDFGRYHGVILRDGASCLLAQHIFAMGTLLERAPIEAMPGISRATLELALGCLAGAISGNSEASVVFDSAWRRQIERHIDTHLMDADLGPDSIAHTFNVSRSTLYRLFDVHAGVANFVKERRLVKIRSILVANEDTRPLADIAEDFGFQSGGHFSREFRRRFGYPPSEVRAAHLVAVPEEAGTQSPLDKMFRMLQP